MTLPEAGSERDRPVLALRGVGKSFHGVPAVVDADLEVRAGETVALVGENGAGKSTLMKIVAGVHPAASFTGTMLVDGASRAFRTIREAEAAGIVLVPQELHIAPDLSVAENMFMGMLPQRYGFVDDAKLNAMTRERLAFFGVDVAPRAPVTALSPSAQRLVTIASALSKSATKVLILDEPTASLTEGESAHLVERMRQVKAQGVGCLYITHRLDELERVADRVVVMRNGRVVARFESAAGRHAEIVRAMIGRDPERRPARAPVVGQEAILQAKAVRVHDVGAGRRPRVDGVDLTLRRGEILGLFGLVGAGRTEFGKALFGAWKGRVEGEVTIEGKPGFPRSPREAIERGIGMLTEDRKRTGLIEGQTVLANISAANIAEIARGSFIDSARELVRNTGLARQLDLRPPRLGAKVETFSGGNQQKILLARWLATHPRILIVDEPTYGVDIGARFEIYRLLREQAAEGRAILMISSDLNEVMEESDRILVMYKGRITGEFASGTSRQVLMAAATGERT